MNQRKLLIVDDEAEILNAIQFLLSKSSSQVLYASSGNDAIEKLKSNDVGLVISDFKMNNGNGETLLNFVLDQRMRLDFYFFTASNIDRFLRDKTIQGHFVKPNDFSQMLTKARDFLRGHRDVAPGI